MLVQRKGIEKQNVKTIETCFFYGRLFLHERFLKLAE